jgi:MFS family permease
VVIAHGLAQFAFLGAQQMALVRLINLRTPPVAVWTGVSIAILGVCISVTGLTYSRLAVRTGLRVIAAAAAAVMAVAIFIIGASNSLFVILLAIGALGLSFGAVSPALYSMVGLESPADIKSTLFGVSAGVAAIGQTLGPLASGTAAGWKGVTVGLDVAAVAAIGLAALLIALGREPHDTAGRTPNRPGSAATGQQDVPDHLMDPKSIPVMDSSFRVAPCTA